MNSSCFARLHLTDLTTSAILAATRKLHVRHTHHQRNILTDWPFSRTSCSDSEFIPNTCSSPSYCYFTKSWICLSVMIGLSQSDDCFTKAQSYERSFSWLVYVCVAACFTTVASFLTRSCLRLSALVERHHFQPRSW